MKPATIAALSVAHTERRAVAFAKRMPDGQEFLLPDATVPEWLNRAGQEALVRDRTGTVLIEGETWFIEARNPTPRILIVGAVQIAQVLVQMAALAGLHSIVIDPRRAFATPARFPGSELTHEWPDVALERLKPDHRTAIVTLTHDPKLDDPALAAAVQSAAFYVGALGSRKTHAARLVRLREAGQPDSALARIHGPAGLDIGAIGGAEIALSIMAEIVAAWRGRLPTRRE